MHSLGETVATTKGLDQLHGRTEMVKRWDRQNLGVIPPFDHLGTPVQLIKAFGGRDGFAKAVHDLQAALYPVTA